MQKQAGFAHSSGKGLLLDITGIYSRRGVVSPCSGGGGGGGVKHFPTNTIVYHK